MNEIRIKELLQVADDRKILHNMTDDEWQNNFAVLKTMITPTTDKRLTRKSTHVRVINRNWTLSKGNSDGSDSLDKRYCDYINDVLKVIRERPYNIDICYHTYQIAELLRFEPELNTRLVHRNGMNYFEVWL